MTTSFAEHQHPRAADGRFTPKDQPEADLGLEAPPFTTTMIHATGTWGPRFHDLDSRLAYTYAPSERAVDLPEHAISQEVFRRLRADEAFDAGRAMSLFTA